MSAPPRTVVVGTAGHIDHGKSELVRALTGTHPDRLREERERGITIDLGFANLVQPDLVLSFVDVPGHERFIKNMLAGASGIDLVLLVVAADESVRPQTREHFQICRLLGLSRGVIALTKTDLADPELVEVAAAEVREMVRGSFLEEADLVPVSARTGDGLPALVAALRSAAIGVEARDSTSRARLPVDRSFTVRGFGTVVTGTLASGTVRTGDELELLTARRIVKVRGIEARGEPVSSIAAGQRTALNLQGISHLEIARGDVLAEPGAFEPTSIFDASVSVLEDAPAALADLARLRLHAGTAEILARARPLGGAEIPPGESGYVQLRLERPAVLVPGERFIFRRYSPAVTMGGGVVVDPFPPKRRKADAGAPIELARLERGDLEGRIETIVSACGDRGIGGEKLAKRLAVRWGDLVGPLDRLASRGAVLLLGEGGGTLLLSAAGLETLAGRCRELLGEFHRGHPLLPGYPLEEFRSRLAPSLSSEEVRAVLGQLERRGAVRIDRDVAALPGHQVSLDTEQSRLSSAIASVFLKGGLAPPDVSEVLRDAGAVGPKGEGVLAHLLREGTLRRLRDGRVFHAQALAELRRKLSEYKAKSPTIDVAGFKDLTGISRKHAIPLLEYLDEERVTVRRGNERVILS